jgi:hypothetical protein
MEITSATDFGLMRIARFLQHYIATAHDCDSAE